MPDAVGRSFTAGRLRRPARSARAIQLINDAGLDADDVRRAVAASEVVPGADGASDRDPPQDDPVDPDRGGGADGAARSVEMNHVEEAEWSDELWRQIVTLWQTAMLRLTKLRLRDEVNDAMRYFELSLLSQGPMLNAAVNAAFGHDPTASGRCCESVRGSAATATATRSSLPTCWPTRSNNRRHWRLGHHLRELWRLAEELSMSSRLVTVRPSVSSWPRLRATRRHTASTSRTARPFAACTPGWQRPRRS